jgi:hypothetical protein
LTLAGKFGGCGGNGPPLMVRLSIEDDPTDAEPVEGSATGPEPLF